eukprot:941707-Prymnesium_polylepis.1
MGAYDDDDDDDDDDAAVAATDAGKAEPPAADVIAQGAVCWQQCYDANSGSHYYWNFQTNEVRWDCPPELQAAYTSGDEPGGGAPAEAEADAASEDTKAAVAGFLASVEATSDEPAPTVHERVAGFLAELDEQ